MKYILIDDSIEREGNKELVDSLSRKFSGILEVTDTPEGAEEFLSEWPEYTPDEATVFYHAGLCDTSGDPLADYVSDYIRENGLPNISFSGGISDTGHKGNSYWMPKADFYARLGDFLESASKGVAGLDLFGKADTSVKPTVAAVDALILPLDGGALRTSLRTAMMSRLEFAMKGHAALCPIIFYGKKSVPEYVAEDYTSNAPQHFSGILTTEGVYFAIDEQKAREMASNGVMGLSAERFRAGFLDRIKINPLADVGNHTISNDWGAFVITRVLDNDSLYREQRARVLDTDPAYLLYLLLSAQSKQTLLSLAADGVSLTAQADEAVPPLECNGQRVLLIDDQDMVWADVVAAMLTGAHLTVWGKSDASRHRDTGYEYRKYITDFDGDCCLSVDALVELDKTADNFDLILLDLRLGGSKEETAQQELSGIKVLRRIMARNDGQQVIVLSSSNKAWNMQKVLLQLRALAYYIKESPEHLHNDEESLNNLEILFDNIELAFSRSDLKTIYTDIFGNSGLLAKLEEVRKKYGENRLLRYDIEAIENQVRASYPMISEASRLKPGHARYAYAFVALEQVLEIMKTWGNNPSSDTFASLERIIPDCPESIRTLVRKRNDFIHASSKPKFRLGDFKQMLDFINSGFDKLTHAAYDEICQRRVTVSGKLYWYDQRSQWQVEIDDYDIRRIEMFYDNLPAAGEDKPEVMRRIYAEFVQTFATENKMPRQKKYEVKENNVELDIILYDTYTKFERLVLRK